MNKNQDLHNPELQTLPRHLLGKAIQLHDHYKAYNRKILGLYNFLPFIFFYFFLFDYKPMLPNPQSLLICNEYSIAHVS